MLQRILAVLPDDHLIAKAPAVETPAILAADPQWLREQIRLRGLIWGIDDPFVLGTLWWYSASNWLAMPTVTSWFTTGQALSARLEDLRLFHHPDSRIPGARSLSLGPDTIEQVGGQLRESLGAVIGALAGIIGKGERRLWSFAVDAIAGRLLWAAERTGRTDEVRDAAGELIAAVGPELPQPRLATLDGSGVEVEGSGAGSGTPLYVRRGSCCLLYQVPEKAKCRNCPRQLPADRLARLTQR